MEQRRGKARLRKNRENRSFQPNKSICTRSGVQPLLWRNLSYSVAQTSVIPCASSVFPKVVVCQHLIEAVHGEETLINIKTSKTMKKNHTIWAGAVLGTCLALTSARADTILNVGLSSPLVIGEVIPQVLSPPGQEARDLSMANTLIGMYNSGSPSAAPYFVSGNSFATPLPPAVTTGDIITPAGGINFTPDNLQVVITIGSGFKYLLAAYDGQNSGAVLWDISGLPAGTILDIPAFALPNAAGTDLVNGADPLKFGITTWSMFSPGTTSVPDGGTTVVLLGAALSGLGLVRRKLA